MLIVLCKPHTLMFLCFNVSHDPLSNCFIILLLLYRKFLDASLLVQARYYLMSFIDMKRIIMLQKHKSRKKM